MSDSVTPWTVARQAPLSMGLSWEEPWRGCHSLLQEIFLTQGSNLVFSTAGRFFTIWATREVWDVAKTLGINLVASVKKTGFWTPGKIPALAKIPFPFTWQNCHGVQEGWILKDWTHELGQLISYEWRLDKGEDFCSGGTTYVSQDLCINPRREIANNDWDWTAYLSM